MPVDLPRCAAYRAHWVYWSVVLGFPHEVCLWCVCLCVAGAPPSMLLAEEL